MADKLNVSVRNWSYEKKWFTELYVCNSLLSIPGNLM